METGHKFRKDVYAKFGVPLPEKPPKKVLFWFRPKPFGRAVKNAEELLAVAAAYQQDVT